MLELMNSGYASLENAAFLILHNFFTSIEVKEYPKTVDVDFDEEEIF